MSKEEISSLNLPGFSVVNSFCRSAHKNGGVIILARDEVAFMLADHGSHAALDDINTECEFESAIAKIIIGDGSIFIVTAYRSPLGNFQLFLSKLGSMLDVLIGSCESSRIILTGDFNCDMLSNTRNREDFVNLLRSFNLFNNVSSPTRCTNHTRTLLDDIISNIDPNLITTKVISSDISDHYPVLSKFSIIQNTSAKFCTMRYFTESNKASFLSSLSAESWTDVLSASDFNDKFNLFHDKFLYYFDISFPLMSKKLSPNKTRNTWITNEIRELSVTLRDLAASCKHNQNPELKRRYNALKAYYRKIINAAKRTYNDSRVLNSNNKSREIWRIINSYKSNSHLNSSFTSVVESGKVITDMTILASRFNDHFAKDLSSRNIPTSTNYPSASFCSSLFLSPCTEKELTSIVNQLGSKMSSGIDDIPNFLVTYCINAIKDILLFLINESLRMGLFPERLKTSKVIPLFKSKGNTSDLNSYRPISIQSVFSKIFEKVFYNRFISFLESNSLLSSEQHGFRRGKSTISAVCDVINHILSALDSKLEIAAMFFDLSKAFDSVNHPQLLKKLYYLGIRGSANNWIQSYLSNRSQQVVIKLKGFCYSSHKKQVTQGVPQGSVLGPILFLTYVNDLSFILANILGAHPVQFADDTNVLVSSTDLETVSSQCNLVSNELSNWCSNNRLNLNAEKSQIVYFKNKNKTSGAISIQVNQKSVPQVDCVKFLGLHLDASLTWEAHISNLTNKLSAKCFLIRSIRYTVSKDVLMALYYGQFYSHLTYGILFWGSSPHATRIFKMQKRAVRLIANSHYLAPCKPIFRKLGLLPFPCVYILHVLLYTHSNFSQFNKNSDVHNHFTRGSNNLHVPFVRTNTALCGPNSMGLKLYNALPNELRCIKSFSVFKCKIKEMLLQKMYYKVVDFIDDRT
jgi:hypothetical protein